MSCIASNPDISGIGVRTAIYAQNILSFVPAIFALLDQKVSPTELETLETQSTTILITAFAILVSTIVQVLTEGITNYHAAIILDLSWMNNTNLFIYFLLYVHHRSGLRIEGGKQDVEANAVGGDAQIDGSPDQVVTGQSVWVAETKRALKNPVFIIGSVHLTLMAAVGIWLWRSPARFGDSESLPCSLSASLVILGRQVPLGSPGLRIWSIFIYSILLTPILNFFIPIVFFLGPIAWYNRSRPNPSGHIISIRQIFGGLAVLATVDIILLIDTEVTIRKNRHLLLDGGDANWTFGQTLALLLLLVPLRDLGETLIERRPKKLGRKLLDASDQGRLDVVEFVLNQGPNTSGKGSALRSAAKNGHIDIVTLLLDYGANIHSKDSSGQTALHLAAGKGHIDVVKVLVKYGSKSDAKDKLGQSPLDLAIAGLHDAAIIYLLSGDPDTSSEKKKVGQVALHWVTVRRMTPLIERLIGLGANANVQDSAGCTPLHLAIDANYPEIIECLLEKGRADVNLKDELGRTPLSIVTGSGDIDMVKYLIGHGADVNGFCSLMDDLTRPSRDQTLLTVAVYAGRMDIIELLVTHGANVNEISRGTGTVLCMAAKAARMDIIKFLMANGARPNPSFKGLGYGPRKSNLDSSDNISLVTATSYGSGGWEPEFGSKQPLYLSAGTGRLDIVEFLLENNADANVKEADRRTALHAAALEGHIDVVRCLLDHGADLTVQDSWWRTPLHDAALHGDLEIVKCLLEHGADSILSDIARSGHTALQFAEDAGHTAVAEYLREFSV